MPFGSSLCRSLTPDPLDGHGPAKCVNKIANLQLFNSNFTLRSLNHCSTQETIPAPSTAPGGIVVTRRREVSKPRTHCVGLLRHGRQHR